jgi:hypothetical protein
VNRAAKAVTAASVAILAAVFGVRSIQRKAHDPTVETAVAKVKNSARNNSTGRVQPVGLAIDAAPAQALATPEQILRDARAVSSFFSSSELAGLNDKQIAYLESLLTSAKRATYDLLIERGKITKLPDGSIRIEIPAQGRALKEMEDFARDSVRSIAAGANLKSLETSLGPRFEAQFAYFGKYDTVIDLSFDGHFYPKQPAEYVTMKSEYSRVNILGIPSGHIKATHVLTLNRFEADYMPLSSLKSEP